MEVVHEAAVGFLKTLRDGDRGAVVTFADSVNILQPLTADRAALEQAVRRAAPRGSTALNNAVYVALKEFGRTAQQDGEVRRQAIAVLSDGEDTSSLVTFDDVLALARKSGVNIYTDRSAEPSTREARADERTPVLLRVGLRDEDAGARNRGAGVLPAGGAGAEERLRRDRRRAREPVLDRLRARATRVPTGASAGSSIKVAAHPELRPRARLGYTADTLLRAVHGGDAADTHDEFELQLPATVPLPACYQLPLPELEAGAS